MFDILIEEAPMGAFWGASFCNINDGPVCKCLFCISAQAQWTQSIFDELCQQPPLFDWDLYILFLHQKKCLDRCLQNHFEGKVIHHKYYKLFLLQ